MCLWINFNLKVLDLDQTSFNRTVDNILPPSLEYLSTGPKFNQSVSNLPPKLHTLELGASFNQNVDKLPRNLKKLTIKAARTRQFYSTAFMQPIKKLPSSLQILELRLSGAFV